MESSCWIRFYRARFFFYFQKVVGTPTAVIQPRWGCEK